VTRPAENQQTVEALKEQLTIALTWVPTPHRDAARAALRDLVALADLGAALESGLRGIEWIDKGEGYDECAYCGMAEAGGHLDDCPLAALLARLDGAR
jgi:hypothetical protein